MNNLVFFLFLFFLPTYSSAQQLPIFTQYREYQGYINPAAVSTDYFTNGSPQRLIKAGMGQRLQWVGNQSFTMQTSIINGEGFMHFDQSSVSIQGGGYFIHDEVDVTTMDGLFGRLGVYIGNPEDASTKFWGGLGFYVGYVFHNINVSKLKSQETDPKLLEDLSSDIPDFGLGLFGVYKLDGNSKILHFGVSAPQFLELNLEFADNSDFNYTRLRHLFGHVAFLTQLNSLTDYSFLEVSAWAKYVQGLIPHVDVNVRYQPSSAFSIGLGASTNSTVHIELGASLPVGKSVSNDQSNNRLRLGYGFDMPFNSNYASYFGGSHEVSLSYLIF